MRILKVLDVHIIHSTASEAAVSKMRTSFSVYGIPKTVCTGNGPRLANSEFELLMTANGIRHVRTAPYHPSSNVIAERVVQILEAGVVKL